jgi:hypothetical protein
MLREMERLLAEVRIAPETFTELANTLSNPNNRQV